MSGRRDTSDPGQALEFEIWSDLIKQSQGALHIFLPLLDRGLDAVLHRMTDGRYIPIQVKGKSGMVEGMVEIVVRADSLVDDNALLIGSYLRHVDGQLDLVVEERIFKKLAARSASQGHHIYSAAFSMHPTTATGTRTSCHETSSPNASWELGHPKRSSKSSPNFLGQARDTTCGSASWAKQKWCGAWLRAVVLTCFVHFPTSRWSRC